MCGGPLEQMSHAESLAGIKVIEWKSLRLLFPFVVLIAPSFLQFIDDE